MTTTTNWIEDLEQPPTEIGAEFRITDLGTEEGGKAIVVIKRAFEDCFEEKALIVEDEYGHDQGYSFQGTSPIYCCHVPDNAYDEDIHGSQTMGFRYSYQFVHDIDTNNPIRVVAWEDTRFPDLGGVLYP